MARLSVWLSFTFVLLCDPGVLSIPGFASRAGFELRSFVPLECSTVKHCALASCAGDDSLTPALETGWLPALPIVLTTADAGKCLDMTIFAHPADRTTQ